MRTIESFLEEADAIINRFRWPTKNFTQRVSGFFEQRLGRDCGIFLRFIGIGGWQIISNVFCGFFV
jgi:hypothetical protein